MKKIIALVIALSCALACGHDNGPDDPVTPQPKVPKENAYLTSVMQDWYYWFDQMPNADAVNLPIKDYFKALLVKQDKWSWMMTGEQYNKLKSNIETSYGCLVGVKEKENKEYDLYMAYAQPNSPSGKAGITRGCQLIKINGQPADELYRQGGDAFDAPFKASSVELTFIDLAGNEVTKTLSEATFQANSVMKTAVYTKVDFPDLAEGDKVGYIVYCVFNKVLGDEIKTAIAKMKSENVTDLILDLRYNSGGDGGLCSDIASLLVPEKAANKILFSFKHSSKKSDQNTSYTAKRSGNSLSLKRLFVITGSKTASASELLINCLKPYMQVIQVGKTTRGKPYGMYTFLYPEKATTANQVEYAFAPICFHCVNARGEGDYEEGITPDKLAFDDCYHDFGPQELNVAQCLTYIATGAFIPDDNTKAPGQEADMKIIESSDAFDYGLYITPQR